VMMLFESTRNYIERKRAAGLTYAKSTSILSTFCTQIGNVPLGCITPRQVAAFLDGPHTSATTWRKKYSLLKSFFEFWSTRVGLQALPMPPIRPPCPQTFVPYVYSRGELRLLLKATRTSQKRASCIIEARTLRALLLFLYETGAQTGEALKLLREKVDLKHGLVTIPNDRFNRARCIPIGPDVHKVMRNVQSTARMENRSPIFFVTRNGKALNAVTLSKTFQRLRRVAGIARQDRSPYQPRMHDLRYTFAVHRLTAWFKQGADLNRMLPALAAYMGQVGLGSTERYLEMTPERFRKQLVKLSPQRMKKRWRDDAALMKFLAEL
jgi:integrase/recombinase XerD